MHFRGGLRPRNVTIEAAGRTRLSSRLLAVDIEPTAILKLNDNLKRKGISNVDPRVASIHNLPFPSNAFDRTFTIAVMGELPDKVKALIEIKRVLTDDELLAIGEFLPDPDYPRRKTVISWCGKADFKLMKECGGILHPCKTCSC